MAHAAFKPNSDKSVEGPLWCRGRSWCRFEQRVAAVALDLSVLRVARQGSQQRYGLPPERVAYVRHALRRQTVEVRVRASEIETKSGESKQLSIRLGVLESFRTLSASILLTLSELAPLAVVSWGLLLLDTQLRLSRLSLLPSCNHQA